MCSALACSKKHTHSSMRMIRHASGAQISRGELSEDEMKQRRERSMADPEIQGILTDPVMTQVQPDTHCLRTIRRSLQGSFRHSQFKKFLCVWGHLLIHSTHEALLQQVPLPFGPKEWDWIWVLRPMSPLKAVSPENLSFASAGAQGPAGEPQGLAAPPAQPADHGQDPEAGERGHRAHELTRISLPELSTC